jgi:hypothetical protein
LAGKWQGRLGQVTFSSLDPAKICLDFDAKMAAPAGSLECLAQRRRTRPRAQRQCCQGQGAEDQQMRACTGSGSTRLDRAGAKHQRRHVERQDE